MRAEDKEVDGPDLEIAERQQQTLLSEHEEEEDRLPELSGEESRDIERERGTRLIDAMKMILDRDELAVRELGLPEREEKALEALQAAVNGRNGTHMFVFAEDRRSMLEQALAVLQSNLTSGASAEMVALQQSMEQLTSRVHVLRDQLTQLNDAQDELLGGTKEEFLKGAEGDTADKPKPKPSDPDAPRPASTVSGPGPEVKREDKPSQLSTGPDAKREPAVSTLSTGPEVKREEAPTTLGDAKEIEAEANKKPWWRRPFG